MKAGRIFHEWAQLPISREEMVEKVAVLQRRYFPDTKPLDGVESLLEKLARTSDPKVHIALATSSHKNNFILKTAHLQQLFSVFPEKQRVLGDDTRIPSGRGKPAPDIYLLALKTINDDLRAANGSEIKPEECLVFEDSVPGVESGRRAGMQVVWCPHPQLLEEYKDREAEVLAGLTGQHREEPIKPKVEVPGKRMLGQPGELRDGWGTLLHTLDNFPYEKWGIKV